MSLPISVVLVVFAGTAAPTRPARWKKSCGGRKLVGGEMDADLQSLLRREEISTAP